jgi:L,D-transpeptidase ErfK/SrfK
MTPIYRMFSLLLLWGFLCRSLPAAGTTYPLPAPDTDLVGRMTLVEAREEDTLIDIARRHQIGQEAILLANPAVDRWYPGEGTPVIIPSRYILPPGPRRGLVLNTPEMRLYYFPEAGELETAEVQVFPVAIGRMGWETPVSETTLVSKERDPAWRPPESIRQEHAAQGDPLPAFVPPGPDNPLGRHALRLGLPGYLIHGTNKAFGVGMRVSHGCVRMLPEDIAWLFERIPVGTPVRIINQPVKVGWESGVLYLEVHPPLEEDQLNREHLADTVWRLIDEAVGDQFIVLNDDRIRDEIKSPSGLPREVSESLF